MQKLPRIILKPGKDQAVRRFHPWIFSGAIKSIEGVVNEGYIAELYSDSGEFLALGHYANGSIAVRVFSFENCVPDLQFWERKIRVAFNLRQRLGLTDNPFTNVYRLVHAEGDGMPGLIIDIYNDTAVLQAHSIGMYRVLPDIVTSLKVVYGDKLKAVFDKSSETLPKSIGSGAKNDYLFGQSSLTGVLENNLSFSVNWEEGQKTGFFIDQRENRKLLGEYCFGKKVLNTFCYSGGFSIYAMKAGASLVHSVDSSKKAIEWTQKNIELNGFDPEIHKCYASDTLDFLKISEEKYDVIVLDPPAYAKHLDAKHKAVQGYKRLNTTALQKINKNGILFTFSCSQVIDKKLFFDTITSAAIESGRKIKVLHQLSQPPDHPVSIFHPEGEYLKGLVLFVE